MHNFEIAHQPPESSRGTHYFVLQGDTVLGLEDQTGWQPLNETAWRFSGLTAVSEHYIGSVDGFACVAVDVAEALQPPGYAWLKLRQLLLEPEPNWFSVVGRAVQIIEWGRTHKYCGRCGELMTDSTTDMARRCEPCQRQYYPRVSPCVIMLVTRGEELLLASSPSATNYYSTLAGFVEAGETLEAAVHREVKEEVGVEIENVRYFGSQPWPFPHQLMLGFYADYAGGELRPDLDEIADAQWFHYRDLPRVPPVVSIAGQLIYGHVEGLEKASR